MRRLAVFTIAMNLVFLICCSSASADSKYISAGDFITIGSYEQDNILANGKEDIEWQVLEVDGNRALLISRYALDCRSFHDEFTDVTWETSAIRQWLNDDFFNAAFSEDEQERIEITTVIAEKNPEYSTSAGNDTNDRIFLLSIQEAEYYFHSDNERVCGGTEYSYEASIGPDGCFWWLRTPGEDGIYTAAVNYDGSVGIHGSNIFLGLLAVRPAMWIEL